MEKINFSQYHEKLVTPSSTVEVYVQVPHEEGGDILVTIVTGAGHRTNLAIEEFLGVWEAVKSVLDEEGITIETKGKGGEESEGQRG